MSISIRDKIRTYLGETYEVLTNRAAKPYDGIDGSKPDLFSQAIAETLDRTFQPNTRESDITSEFVGGYVAMIATRRCIPAAINYHMEKTGLSDSIGQGIGGAGALDGLSSETRQHYDRVRSLQELDGMLRTSLREGYADFRVLAGSMVRGSSTAVDSAPGVSTFALPWISQSPYAMPTVADRWCGSLAPLASTELPL